MEGFQVIGVNIFGINRPTVCHSNDSVNMLLYQ